MYENIKELEQYLRVNEGFFCALQKEDDWTCIIKLFSLLEASTSSMIAENLLHPELIDAFSFIQMGTKTNGKLAFIKTLKLLPDRYITFIETLGWLRNKYAHNISTSKGTIKSFLNTISSKRRKECERNLHLTKSVKINGKEFSGEDFFNDNPRALIFFSCQVVLEHIRQMTILGQQLRKIKKESVDIYLKDYGSIKININDFNLEE